MKQIFGSAEEYGSFVDFSMFADAHKIQSEKVENVADVLLDPDDQFIKHMLEMGPFLLDARIDPEIRLPIAGRVESLQNMIMKGTENV